VWSGFTILCGAAQSFPHLLAARFGVGIGEAGGTPASHSIITAIMPRSRRAVALSIYAMGVPIGTLLGMTLGGVTADLWGWRMAFVVAGVPGILLCIVAALTLREPIRRTPPIAAPMSMTSAFSELMANPSVPWTIAGSAGASMVFFGQAAFTASFLQRVHGPELLTLGAEFGLGPQGFVGASLGLTFGIGGLLGNLMGGPLADRAARRNPGGYLIPPAIGALAYIPLGFGCFLAPDVVTALLFLAGSTTAGMIFYGPSFAALHSIVRPELRSSASALALVALNLIGYGCGPLLIGIMTDILAGPMAMGQGEGLRWSLIGLSIIGGLIAPAAFFRASRLMAAELSQRPGTTSF
jgi:MFS family permease